MPKLSIEWCPEIVTAQQAKLLGVASLFVIRQARMLTASTATPSVKSGGEGFECDDKIPTT
jgi:hypothetical protein